MTHPHPRGIPAIASLSTLALALALGACGGDEAADADAGMAADTGRATDAAPMQQPDRFPPAEEGRPPPHPWADHPFLRPGPLVIAHRGGRRLGPECTMFTYRLAVEAGADALEADLHLTADGHVVVMHDHEVDRTTDGNGAIANLTLAEIKALDAAYAYDPEGGYPLRGTGVTVATLDELLEAFPEMPLSLEIKQDDPPMIEPLLAVLDAHDARGRVLVAAYADLTTADFRAAAPDVLTAMAVGEVIGWATLPPGPGVPWQPPGHALQVPVAQAGFELVTATNVAHAGEHGVLVHPYTINDPEEMRQMLDFGVDGIITDDPAGLRAVIDGR